jgi:LacI family transcriptional regulator
LNPQEIGYKAASLLDSKMKRPERKGSLRKRPRKPILVPPSGVVARDSSNLVAVTDSELDQAIKIIGQNAVYGLTVEELAEEMLISRSTLERRFREYFKCSPAQEINHVRIERAKSFLRETAWPISAVGQKTGFASPENFVRFFRRLVGETPRQYRNRHYGEDHSA